MYHQALNLMKYIILLFGLVLLSLQVMAQQIIKGKITDKESGAAIQGATITITGTTNSTQSGANGAFSITSPAVVTSVTVSFMGYETRLIKADSAARFMNI